MIKDKTYYQGLDKRTNEFKDWKKQQDLQPHVPATTEDLQAHVDNVVEDAEHEAMARVVRSNNDLIRANNLIQSDLEAKHEANPTIEITVGAGDIVESITKATGIKAVIDYFTPEGEDCGCEERKAKLNEKTSIVRNKRVECLTLAEYNYMRPLLNNNAPLNGDKVKKLLVIYARVFNAKIITSCNGCSMTQKLDELKAVLKTYDHE